MARRAGPRRRTADPEIAAIKQQLNEIVNGQRTNAQSSQQAEAHRVIGQIESFADAKDDKGTALHPHFGEVEAQMTVLAQAKRSAGEQPTLDVLVRRSVLDESGGARTPHC